MAAVSPSTRDLSKYSRLFHNVFKRVGGIRRRDERDGFPRMRGVLVGLLFGPSNDEGTSPEGISEGSKENVYCPTLRHS